MRTIFAKIKVKQQFKDQSGTLFEKISSTQASKLHWPFPHTGTYNVEAHESFELIDKPTPPAPEPAPF